MTTKGNQNKRSVRTSRQLGSDINAAYGRPNTMSNETGVSSTLVEAVCSQIDPFCGHAVGAKLFDRDGSRTIPNQVRYTLPITTDSSGRAAVQFKTQLTEFLRSAATFVGSTGEVATWGTPLDIPDYANYGSYFSSFRVVNAGVRVVCSASLTASQGIVTLITTPGSIDDPDYSLSNYAEVDRFALAELDAHWIAKPLSSTQSSFISTAATYGDSHNVLTVMVQGAAATTSVLFIEVIMNIELTPALGNSIMSRLATPAAPHNTWVEQAGANALRFMGSTMEGAAHQVSNRVKQLATNALKNLGQYAGTRLLQYGARVAPLMLTM